MAKTKISWTDAVWKMIRNFYRFVLSKITGGYRPVSLRFFGFKLNQAEFSKSVSCGVPPVGIDKTRHFYLSKITGVLS